MTADAPSPRDRIGPEPSRLPDDGVGGFFRSAGYVNWLDVATTLTFGPVLYVVAIGLALTTPPSSWAQLFSALGLGAIFIVAFRTELTRSFGSTVATQPVLLALALCTPAQWLPVISMTATYLATTDAGLPKTNRLRMLRLGWGSNAFGLALVVLASGMSWHHWSWGWIALAYLAEISVDAFVGGVRAAVQNEEWSTVLPAMGMTFVIDALLGTVGLAIIVLAGGRFPDLVLLLVPVLLIWMLSRDRQQQYEESVELESAMTQVAAQARLDALTGLANRRVWEEAMARATAVSGPGGPTVTVLLADLDHLKVANDVHGHEEGDLLLVQMAGVLQQSAPPGATAARIGGDEFGILVIGGAGETPPDLVSAVRAEIAAHVAANPDMPVPLSSSLGQASTPPCLSVEEAVTRADHNARLDKATRRVRRQDTFAADPHPAT